MSEQTSNTTSIKLSRCFMRFDDRAERFTTQQIVTTFVSAGPLLDVLANRSHQVIYGRRGVGKTHALRYYQSTVNTKGDLAIYVDCANLGSSNSTYNDTTLTLYERATRLLIDVCTSMHWAFADAFSDPARGWDLAEVAPRLNGFIDAITQVHMDGSVVRERRTQETDKSGTDFKIGGSLSVNPGVSASYGTSNNIEAVHEIKEKREGKESTIINFQFLAQRTAALVSYIAPRRVWLLVDEWSTVPIDLQPYLADLLRRSFFSVPNVSVKIAAIEQRSAFRAERADQGYIGIELGADATVALNLDEYLAYDVNPTRASQFFRTLIENHVGEISREDQLDLPSDVLQNWTVHAFTQEPVFTELVKACEGVPRDAMHILANAAQRTPGVQIAAPILRYAALSFFQAEKYSAIASNPLNRKMLDWIRFKVIDQRNTRAFLLPVGTIDPIIEKLFDLRALHILNRSMSAAHRPGERYVVYKLDYGCYVDLTNTGKYPSGLIFRDDLSTDVNFDVPDDDARSYRRAILDLDEFYLSNGSEEISTGTLED
jgi:hypothetical protein